MAFAECMYVGSEAEAIAEKYGKRLEPNLIRSAIVQLKIFQILI